MGFPLARGGEREREEVRSRHEEGVWIDNKVGTFLKPRGARPIKKSNFIRNLGWGVVILD